MAGIEERVHRAGEAEPARARCEPALTIDVAPPLYAPTNEGARGSDDHGSSDRGNSPPSSLRTQAPINAIQVLLDACTTLFNEDESTPNSKVTSRYMSRVREKFEQMDQNDPDKQLFLGMTHGDVEDKKKAKVIAYIMHNVPALDPANVPANANVHEFYTGRNAVWAAFRDSAVAVHRADGFLGLANVIVPFLM